MIVKELEKAMLPYVVMTENFCIADKTTWYEVAVFHASLDRWIRQQDEELWGELPMEWEAVGVFYNVHEKLMAYVTLKWGN